MNRRPLSNGPEGDCIALDKSFAVDEAGNDSKIMWLIAHIGGGAALLWIAIVNGYPLLHPDSGSYLRVGTELHFLTDRPIVYGLMIAPFARIAGLWAIIVAQAFLACFLIGATVKTITGRRSAILLFLSLLGLALFSSLPWFVGQIMPDLLPGLMALLIFDILFAPGGGTAWRRWWPPVMLVPLIAAHLGNLPIAAALTAIGGATAALRRVPSIRLRVGRAMLAFVAALIGLCCLNLIGVHRFTPSIESNKFLAARLFDGRVGQPVLDGMCRAETLRLCSVRAMLNDPRRAQPGQDYLWEDIGDFLATQDVEGLRAEERILVRRTIRERPLAVVRLALAGWSEQLIDARSADGMVPYPQEKQVMRQIRVHFPQDEAAVGTSRQQRGILQKLAIFPDRLLSLVIVLLTPFLLIRATQRGDSVMIGLVSVVLATVLINAAVCGILSVPADRYQSRVIWLLPLLGALALSRRPQEARNA